MAVCGDKDMAPLTTIWAQNLQVCGRLLVREFLQSYLRVDIRNFVNIHPVRRLKLNINPQILIANMNPLLFLRFAIDP